MTETVPGHPHVRFERRDGRDVVVKTGLLLDLQREATALAHLASASVQVLDLVSKDGVHGELVTARVLPGDDLRPLSRVDDDTATYVVGDIIVALRAGGEGHSAANVDLPNLSGVLEVVRRCRDDRLPRSLCDVAHSMAEELLDTPSQSVLHGDLQHRNIARSRDSDGVQAHAWLALDPHGWWGDRTFELVPVLVAPDSLVLGSNVVDARGMDPTALMRKTQRRIDILTQITGDDPQRVWTWVFVGAVIAEARMLASHNLVHGAPLALAQALVPNSFTRSRL